GGCAALPVWAVPRNRVGRDPSRARRGGDRGAGCGRPVPRPAAPFRRAGGRVHLVAVAPNQPLQQTAAAIPVSRSSWSHSAAAAELFRSAACNIVGANNRVVDYAKAKPFPV